MPIRLTEKYHKVCNIFRSEKTAFMSNGSYDGKRGDRRASSLYRPKDEMYPSSHHEDLSESERWSSEPWELDVENEDEIVLVLPDRFYEPDRYSGSDSDVETMSENPLLSKLKRSLFPAAIKPISLQERLVRTQNVWCVPNLNRDRAEKLLRGAEPGNFILRVNQDEDAMVLSRCTVENDERTVRGEESPVTVVRHNIIEVLPRSGYCLTGDKQAHLIFSSLIQLVHFYMRLSRLHCQNGPFLRLPKTILDAKTVGDLEAINRQGSDFWKTVNRPTGNQLHSQTILGERHKNRSVVPRAQEPYQKRGRSTSADRWNTHENQRVLAPLDRCKEKYAVRSNRHQPRPNGEHTRVSSHKHLRERASSLNAATADKRAMAGHLIPDPPIPSNGGQCGSIESARVAGYPSNDYESECKQDVTQPEKQSVSSATRQANQWNPSGISSVTTSCLRQNQLQNSRPRGYRDGVYEGDQGDFWPSFFRRFPNESPAKRSLENTSVISNSSEYLKQTHKTFGSANDSDQSWPTNLPTYSIGSSHPNRNAAISSDIPAHHHIDANGCKAKNMGSNRNRSESASRSPFVQYNPTSDDLKPKDVCSSHPTSDLLLNRCVDNSGQFRGAENGTSLATYLASKIVANGSMGESKATPPNWGPYQSESDEPESVTLPRKLSDSGVEVEPKSDPHLNFTKYIELPAPKTVGHVFVMEAATYSNDDYELLSNSSSMKPPSDTGSFKSYATVLQPIRPFGNWTADESGPDLVPDDSIKLDRPKLRRALTARDPNRSRCWRQANEDYLPNEAEQSRRHGRLFDTQQWNNDLDEILASTVDESQGSLRRNNTTKVVWSSEDKCLRTRSTPNGKPQVKPNYDNSVPNTSSFINQSKMTADDVAAARKDQFTTKIPSGREEEIPTPVCPNERLACDSAVASCTPILTLLSAPRAPQCNSTNDADRSRAKTTSKSTNASRSAGDSSTTDKNEISADITNPSPSPSSRASTVFCTPWDVAPMGLYLSDLINLSQATQNVCVNSNKRDQSHRRRTLSGAEHRLSGTDGNSGGEMPPAETMDRVETQKRLLQWMQANNSQGTNGDQCAETSEADSSHPDAAPPPPPLPLRRRRHKPWRYNITTGDLQQVAPKPQQADISPYAITTCQPFHPPDADVVNGEMNSNICSTGTPQPATRVEDPGCQQSQTEAIATSRVNSRRPSLCRQASVDSADAPAQSEPVDSEREWPENYVYAQVLPRHLRVRTQSSTSASQNDRDQSTSKSEAKSTDSVPEPISPDYCRTDKKPIGGSTLSASTSGDLLTQSSSDGRERSSGGCRYSDAHSLSTTSSETDSLPEEYGVLPSASTLTPRCLYGNEKQYFLPNGKPSKPHCPGQHIRRFVRRLMKERKNPISEQIDLFLECTRDRSDRGPYRTMQSIRQFINGMTNYLLRNPNLGLPAAVELEKRDLTEWGFLNVGAIVEAALQRYVLRPLYRHVIKQLKQEQIKHNELEPLRAKVHLARSSGSFPPPDLGIQNLLIPPSETTINQIGQIFHRMECTYSVNKKLQYLVQMFTLIRNDIKVKGYDHHHDMDTPLPEVLQPIYGWIFARAGLLLSPLVPEPYGPNITATTAGVPAFCPAAIQADYLDGLLTKSLMGNQASGQCCLDSLFGMLYWAWKRPTIETESSFELLSSSPAAEEHFTNPRTDESYSSHSFGKNTDLDHPNAATLPSLLDYVPPSREALELSPSSYPTDGFFGSTKRRIIPPRRRKTITGLHFTPNNNINNNNNNNINGSSNSNNNGSQDASSSCNSPTSPTKFTMTPKSHTLNRSLSKQSTIDRSSDSVTNPVPSLSTRWRPWAQHSGTLQSASEKPIPQPLRVLVMDEVNGRMQVQYYPMRPNLTANELSNMIAFKMNIYDPKEFALFACVDGREFQLDDSLYLADLTEASGTSDTCGSQQTIPDRSQNNGTLGSMRTEYGHGGTTLTKQQPVSHSLSSRSNSPTSSSSGSHGQQQQQQQQQPQRYGRRGIRNTPSWWILCKKGADGTEGRTVTSTEFIGQAPTAVDYTGTINSQSFTFGKPVLIYRRASGFFAISNRILYSNDGEKSPTPNI